MVNHQKSWSKVRFDLISIRFRLDILDSPWLAMISLYWSILGGGHTTIARIFCCGQHWDAHCTRQAGQDARWKQLRASAQLHLKPVRHSTSAGHRTVQPATVKRMRPRCVLDETKLIGGCNIVFDVPSLDLYKFIVDLDCVVCLHQYAIYMSFCFMAYENWHSWMSWMGFWSRSTSFYVSHGYHTMIPNLCILYIYMVYKYINK